MIHHCCSVISSGEMIAVFVYVLICLHSHWSALSINADSEMNCHYSPYCTVMSIIAGSDHIAEKNELVGGLGFLWSAFASSATACISRVRETACLQFCFWLYCNSWRNIRHFHDIFLWLALAGPFKNSHGVVVKPLLRYFSCVLRVIVLLEGKPSAQSEVLSTLEKVFVQDIPVLGHIHLSLDCNQSSCPCSWKTPPQHDAATTMLHCWGRPIIGADIKHFTDYRYRPFSKQICR